MDSLDHVAIQVADIAKGVEYFTGMFDCEVAYQDETWAFIKFANTCLALVHPSQHPPHVAFARDDAERFGDLKTHRDATRSCYIAGPEGNVVEIMDGPSLQRATWAR